MPVIIALYDTEGLPQVELGRLHRNTLLVSPDNSLALLGGFGNLRGDADIVDLRLMRRVTSFKARDMTSFSWSADSQVLAMASCFPRMRVDNSFSI